MLENARAVPFTVDMNLERKKRKQANAKSSSDIKVIRSKKVNIKEFYISFHVFICITYSNNFILLYYLHSIYLFHKLTLCSFYKALIHLFIYKVKFHSVFTYVLIVHQLLFICSYQLLTIFQS